eukprot:TRINITY_DN3089_c0_g2_i1.p1 TRINITY_DN3089_c0_g2~~TRINITY_DN3089_c0_g2_i1.p1  ORF type:complete len:459 (-),score=70.59 TRINITY_DN3089_c0_g2_i1:74-1450(-)
MYLSPKAVLFSVFWALQTLVAVGFLTLLLLTAILYDCKKRIKKAGGVWRWFCEAFNSTTEAAEMNYVPSGWKLEPHDVETEDGYVLTTFRVRKLNVQPKNPKGVVFLQHGMFQTSLPYVMNQPSSALAYLLVEQGYDVFIGNNRGNVYSRRHRKYHSSQAEFWDFSIDELALDVKANIHYICRITAAPSIFYVGHSQGCAQSLAALSTDMELQQKVRLLVCLAPGSFVNRLTSSSLRLLASLHTRWPRLHFLLFGYGGFLPFMETVRDMVPLRIFSYFAYCMFNFLFDWSDNLWDPKKVDLYFSETPSATSSRIVSHWFQLSECGDFRKYDHGCPRRNYAKYSSEIAPSYPLHQLQVPTAVMWGGKDVLINVKKLIHNLPRCVFTKCVGHHEHMDSLNAMDAVDTVYQDLIQLFHSYSNISPPLPSVPSLASISTEEQDSLQILISPTHHQPQSYHSF